MVWLKKYLVRDKNVVSKTPIRPHWLNRVKKQMEDPYTTYTASLYKTAVNVVSSNTVKTIWACLKSILNNFWGGWIITDLSCRMLSFPSYVSVYIACTNYTKFKYHHYYWYTSFSPFPFFLFLSPSHSNSMNAKLNSLDI